MKYQNAKDFLDEALLEELQKQAGGRLLYVPTVGEKKNWGEVSGERTKLRERNRQICREYANGFSVRELAAKWYLSVASIRKILAADKHNPRQHYLGLDIGGTFVKYGVVDEDGQMLLFDSVETPNTEKEFVRALYGVIDKVREQDPHICGIGVGCAGLIENGNLVTAANLPFKSTPLRDLLASYAELPVLLENDANCAALGEYNAAEDMNMLYITLGTGVGGGLILNRQLYRGSRGAAGEVGHIIIVKDGEPCPCGKRGCFEQYASATALVRQTAHGVQTHPASLLAAMAKEAPMDGRLVFNAAKEGCPVAHAVIDTYCRYLATGIDSLCDVLDPQHVVLAGGITKEGEGLLAPLRNHLHTQVRVTVAQNRGQSGVLGAARLFSPSGGR